MLNLFRVMTVILFTRLFNDITPDWNEVKLLFVDVHLFRFVFGLFWKHFKNNFRSRKRPNCHKISRIPRNVCLVNNVYSSLLFDNICYHLLLLSLLGPCQLFILLASPTSTRKSERRQQLAQNSNISRLFAGSLLWHVGDFVRMLLVGCGNEILLKNSF